MKRAVVLLCVGLVLALAVPQARAGVIDGWADATGEGWRFVTQVNNGALPPTAPNNDNADGQNPNAFGLTKAYNAFPAYLDLEYTVSNSQGTTEYLYSETVYNETDIAWLDYHFELGFGTGDEFVRSNVWDFLDFDAPAQDPAPTSSVFASLDYDSNLLSWAGGVLAPGATGEFTFAIDVPDYDPDMPDFAIIRDVTGAPIGYRFTLRQYPTVPEPGTLALLGLGVLGVLHRRRK